jgi:cysteine sulfinate desulfinase/cysteine desulfurase-like protein
VGRAINGRTVLVRVVPANNEVGTIQPSEEIARIARARGMLGPSIQAYDVSAALKRQLR